MSEEKKKAEQIAILFCAETDVIKPNFSSIKQAKKHVMELIALMPSVYVTNDEEIHLFPDAE